jgi:hypothetical protein
MQTFLVPVERGDAEAVHDAAEVVRHRRLLGERQARNEVRDALVDGQRRVAKGEPIVGRQARVAVVRGVERDGGGERGERGESYGRA